ncbi:hypothetical protein GCM10010174_82050 [Kutzneria viridogrisea]|uniref:Uncharacterized protein n=2 Tax=Kutzneria TaxID=43356 RepID=W5WGW3_9PSEU|nr:hypothetical protein [Kutzneria albida]AHI00093.1 hypothetical protein KALB_6734 [Kutzneria albida DSM 43870]MBA8925272.1 hypothetical protein [Kutzneria viridogrisea]
MTTKRGSKKQAKRERNPAALPELSAAELAAEFLADNEVRDEEVVDLIIEHGFERLGHPLAVSPRGLRDLVSWAVNGEAVYEEIAALPEVLPRWAEWAARRGRLSEEDRTELVEQLPYITARCEQEVEEFRHAVHSFQSYLDGVDPGDAEAVAEAVARRGFAVPQEPTSLDPADEEDRGLLVRSRESEPAAEAVANQLWHNDPPQVWQAAQRLLDAGVDRDAAFRLLARTLRQHPDRYVQALAELGR